MLKRQKEVIQSQLADEEKIIKELEVQYKRAIHDISDRIRVLLSDEMTQSRIYHVQYQKALMKQVGAILEKLHSDEYTSIQQYLKNCYTDTFLGTMYDLAGQGMPIIVPIDQKAAVKAILTDSKLSEALYDSLGIDTAEMKKAIRMEITRGIASSMEYADIVRNITNATGAPLSRAKVIVRTEGHRIQQASAEDSRQAAKAKGADVVKQWDATLDGATRKTHRKLDGQIREVDEPFEANGKKAMYPGDFGDPAEDCNCRCVALTRARAALDEDELKTMKERAAFFGIDKTDSFEEFKKNYLKAAETLENTGKSGIMEVQRKALTKINVADIPPMDEGTFKRIKASLEKQGVKVIQDADSDSFLEYMEAEALTLSDGSGILFQSGRIPSASAVYEEVIHVKQIQRKGAVSSEDTIEYLNREIEANEKVLKNKKAYHLTELDIQSIEHNLAYYYEQLKEVNGGV